MRNSDGASDCKVEAIYRVRRRECEEGFAEKIRKRRKPKPPPSRKKGRKTKTREADVLDEQDKLDDALNRRLLWHGSKAANLLSILHCGLRARPAPAGAGAGAPLAGATFGRGLYTADAFDKSWGYCFDWRSTEYHGSRYMMLCDVALGKVCTIRDHESYQRLHQGSKFPPPGRDSVVAVGRRAPDPINDVRVDSGALAVPMGAMGAKETFGRNYFGEYSEFVTYEDSQAAVRYLLKIHNPDAEEDKKRLAEKRRRKRRSQPSVADPIMWGPKRKRV